MWPLDAQRRLAFLAAGMLSAAPAPAQPAPAVAFFYGKPVPAGALTSFDWVVIQAENLTDADLQHLLRAKVEVFAYLSLGEAAPSTVPLEWVLGKNRAWGTAIMNPGAAGWRRQVLERAEALSRRGFRGLFLDTLDSYAMALPAGEAREAARASLAGLVRALHERHPDLRLFFNRGFELLDEVGPLAAGLAAESLIRGWDPASRRYVEVPPADREWLARRLRGVTERFGIPVVVVEYLPEPRGPASREVARSVEGMGFVPWISTPELDVMGAGLEAPARRVLLLHDGAEHAAGGPDPVLAMIAGALRSSGWGVELVDVRRELPRAPLSRRCAGVVTWFADDDLPAAVGYPRWLAAQMEIGVRVAILGRPGFPASKAFLSSLGLAAAPEGSASRVVRIARRDGLVGLEAEPLARSRGLLRWRAVGPSVTVHLRLLDDQGQPIDPVVTAPWGGMALQPYLLEAGYQGRLLWIIDPAAFLGAALGTARTDGAR